MAGYQRVDYVRVNVLGGSHLTYNSYRSVGHKRPLYHEW